MVTASQILSALSDDKALLILNWIIRDGAKSEVIINRLKLTPEQYHSRLSTLTDSGVVERKNGKYSLTSLGWVVHEALRLIESGVNYYWSLKAIDSIRPEFSDEERNKIIEHLIDKREIRELVIRKLRDGLSKKE